MLPARRWRVEGAIALLALGLIAEVFVLGVRAHALQKAEASRSVLSRFSERLDRRSHECIPLGWYPAALPSRGYYPGYNADVADQTGVFQSEWVAVVRPHVSQPQAAAVKSVLDEFARLDLLKRRALPDGIHYTLTHEGARYFYERNDLSNNVERWPYLCFSRLRTTRIVWSSRTIRGARWYVSRRVRFSWTARADGPWITPFLRAHAVELPPISNPAEAEARQYVGQEWRLTGENFEPAVLENPSAWTNRNEAAK